jgi:excinuclease ABC subunit A
MGPEGGSEGGYIVAEGTPTQVVEKNEGYTAAFLAEELKR